MTIGHGNTLYYGDNLDILRRYVDDESVDLIYLDPPFNSNADYNVTSARPPRRDRARGGRHRCVHHPRTRHRCIAQGGR